MVYLERGTRFVLPATKSATVWRPAMNQYVLNPELDPGDVMDSGAISGGLRRYHLITIKKGGIPPLGSTRSLRTKRALPARGEVPPTFTGAEWSKRQDVVGLSSCLFFPHRTYTSQHIRLSIQEWLIAMAMS